MTSSAGAERIHRHQNAAEIVRARSVLVAACLLWVVCGAGLDIATHDAIGTGSLTFILSVRFATSLFHLAVVAPLFRTPLPSPRVASLLITSVFPVTSFALMLIATHQGGLASPYAVAVLVVVMGHTIAWPLSWKQGAIHAALSSGVYLVGIVACADLDDAHARAVFAVYAAVIVAGAIVAAWGGHVMWTLRQSVFQSRKLGRYRLQKRIGKGGMGEVWRAEDRALRRQVALKILSPEHGKKPSLVARFEREIHATAAIVHPNVVRIHDWGVTDDGVWYYAMDALNGADLATVVKRCGPLPPALALHLFIPAAGGLAEAHCNGIVHRDVKPGNMFVVAPQTEPQRLELLDFGIADIGDDAELTQAGAIMGTPGYMAPEVLAGAPGSIAGDIYGLAASLYFALTGHAPKDTDDAPLPAEIDDVLVRALDAEPSRRHASADEFAADLARVNLTWCGSFPIDRMASPLPPSLHGDPTDAPATQVEARRAETV